MQQAHLQQIRHALGVLERATIGAEVEAGPTFRELWALFAEVYEHRLGDWVTESGRAENHLLPYFGGRDVLALTLRDLELYRSRRRSETSDRTKRPVSAATRNREIGLLQRVLNFAVRFKYIAHNPIAGAEPEPEHGIRRAKVQSERELQRLLRRCTPLIRALVVALHDSGMRRLEVMRLRWDQIERSTRWVTLTRTKRHQARRVRLSPRAARELATLPRFCPWVFANPSTGQPFSPRWLYRKYRKAIARAGLVGPGGEPYVLHTLRHTFAYVARRRRKLPERAIMAMGGWKTRSAFDRYGITDEAEIAEAWDVVDIGVARDLAELRSSVRRGPRKGPR